VVRVDVGRCGWSRCEDQSRKMLMSAVVDGQHVKTNRGRRPEWMVVRVDVGRWGWSACEDQSWMVVNVIVRKLSR
jgi:hypothetical protein